MCMASFVFRQFTFCDCSCTLMYRTFSIAACTARIAVRKRRLIDYSGSRYIDL